MLPLNEFIDRFRGILDSLDAAAEETGDEALDDLNAEFDDMLLLLSDIRPGAGDWQAELADALSDLDALADDYDRLTSRLPEVTEPLSRLRMALALIRNNM